MAHMMRSRLADVTNAGIDASQGRKRSRAQAEEQDDAIKASIAPSRTLLQDKGNKIPTSSPSISPAAGFDARRGCNHRLLRQSRLALSSLSTTPLSTRPILESFVSSDTDDIYTYERPDQSTPVPFFGSYSHASRQGKDQLLACGTLGQIQLLNTTKNNDSCTWPTGIPVQFAVMDLLWRGDDKRIAAACEETMTICDVETHRSVQHFVGHTASIKSLSWNPSNDAIIASAGRDGNICIWDLRLHSGAYDAKVAPVLVIKQAHNPTARRKRNIPASTSKSVTSILYLPEAPYHLISSGSADGILMKWDCRSAKSISLPYQESPEDPTTAFMQSKRARGITSLAFGPNASTIYGLGTDGIPYTYLTHSLQAIPASHSSSSSPQHGASSSISFSSTLSVSPCGRWLATSGADSRANLYEIPHHSGVVTREPVVQLNNHAHELTGLTWAGSDTLGICSNDFTVRIWRSDVEVATRCRRASDRASDWKWAQRC